MNSVTVFKILTARDWRTAQSTGAYAGSPDDLRDGYIHLSTGAQVAGTLKRHFSGALDLVLVAYDADALGNNLRFETSRGGDLFPHLYAALPTASALWFRQLETDADGNPFCPEDWLAC